MQNNLENLSHSEIISLYNSRFNIQSRFPAFYARQGSPGFDKKKLAQGIMDKILAD